ncbi:thioesterase family protein [Tindallia californiensis]|uniref:Predicted thioesterase n=1 Tax=Tindallia californiensis TaxID=159292 RepID=A0A1H3L6B5_9FIRM|nr:thioesterase family protein [Tindallia californiensis]SDY59953.1 Predicted thioesterase [Tindallia californiensis]
MEFNLEIGILGKTELTVTEEKTAVAYGSGGIDVFATPAMIGVMENAALKIADQHLPDGWSTVGTRLDVRHIAATPKGMKVRAEAKLIAVKGKQLTFEVTAYDDEEKIGEGIHDRYIINKETFLNKTEEKKARQT